MRVLGLNGIGSVPACFCVINPPMFSAIRPTKNSAPSVHRTPPCTKLVGNKPFERKRREDRQDEEERRRNGNARAIFFGGSSEGIGLIETNLNREMVGRDAD